jgi:SAM-dependent methyltransferase
MLRDHEDAYGYEIFDYYQGEDVVEIVEREDGFMGVSSGPLVYFLSHSEFPTHYKEALLNVQGKVLDVGCGAGRISLYLQDQGHPTLGIDISPKAIEVCGLRGVKNAQVLSITQISSVLGPFDTIVMFGNNFGLMANPLRAKWLLRRFHNLTPDKGLIIAESNDIYLTKEPVHLEYHQYNHQRGRMAGQIRLRIRHKKRKTPWFDYLMVSKAEMEEILRDTGWQVRDFKDSEGSSYVAIIEKTMQ